MLGKDTRRDTDIIKFKIFKIENTHTEMLIRNSKVKSCNKSKEIRYKVLKFIAMF